MKKFQIHALIEQDGHVKEYFDLTTEREEYIVLITLRRDACVSAAVAESVHGSGMPRIPTHVRSFTTVVPVASHEKLWG